VQQDNRLAIGRPDLGIGHIEDAGVDLLQRSERGVRARFDVRQPLCRRLGGLRLGGADDAELRSRCGHGGRADGIAAKPVDVF
jgi:hypothetical protein